MNLQRPALSLIATLLVVGGGCNAATVPAVGGTLENLTDFRSQDIKVWVLYYCAKVINLPHPDCDAVRKVVTVNAAADGAFKIPQFRAPAIPSGFRYGLILYVETPDGEIHSIASEIDRPLPATQNALVFQIDSAPFRFRLANGGSYRDWIENVAPNREIHGFITFTFPDSPHPNELDRFRITADDSSPPPYTGVLTLPNKKEVRMKLSFDAGADRIDEFIFDLPLTRTLFSDLEELVLDSSRLNANIDGHWTGSISPDSEIIAEAGFRVDYLEAELNAACVNQRLTGNLITRFSDGSGGERTIPLSGNCEPGSVDFTAAITFKEYLGRRLATFPVRFESNEISTPSAYFVIQSATSGKKLGGSQFWSER